MRSRDGYNYLTRTICKVAILNLLVFSPFLKADSTKEFLISYRYMVKDAALYNETLHISKSMRKCVGTPKEPLILVNTCKNNLKHCISKNYEEFIDYIHKLGLFVDHKSKTINYQNSSTTILTLKTTCFKVDFNDNFVKIAPLK